MPCEIERVLPSYEGVGVHAVLRRCPHDSRRGHLIHKLMIDLGPDLRPYTLDLIDNLYDVRDAFVRLVTMINPDIELCETWDEKRILIWKTYHEVIGA